MGSGAWSKIFVLNPCNGEHGSLLCIQGQAIRQAKTRKVMMMKKLVNEVAEKFNGKILDDSSVRFSFGDDGYCLMDCTIYAVTEDGVFLPGFKKVKSLLAVENFVAARA